MVKFSNFCEHISTNTYLEVLISKDMRYQKDLDKKVFVRILLHAYVPCPFTLRIRNFKNLSMENTKLDQNTMSYEN
jgi:hypothetical protein